MTSGQPSSATSTRAAPAGTAAARANQPRRHPDPWRTAFFGVLVIAILAGVAWAFLGSSLLVVRHVRVTGNRLVPAAQVLQAARIRTGQPLASLDTTAVARRVEQIGPVLSATVSRSWPDAVVITVRERTPVLAVALTSGGYELVDRYGVVVRDARRRPPGLMLLSPRPAVLRGSGAVRGAALVLQHLPSPVRRRIVSVSATPAGAVTLHLADGVTVLWGGPGQSARKAAELSVLLRKHARYYDVSDPATAVTRG